MPILIDDKLLEQIERKHLRYINDDIAGIGRKKQGKSFEYFDPNGVKIHNKNTIERIEKLVIPPAWENVWISPYQHSHLQATGFDDKGRKQYIYHEEWTKICQEKKFDHLLKFAKALPKIRRQVRKDLELSRLERERILATVVWLLEHTFIRVGNVEYANSNDSFGLTTLRNKHVSLEGKRVKFNFMGKSHVEHEVEVVNPRIIKTIKKCLELPGYELFQYYDDAEIVHPIDSGQVNEYLQSLTGEEVTAKDFRTWGGTLLCAQTLYKYEDEEEDREKIFKIAVKEVSNHLRNTPNVCREYYIHPIIETYHQKDELVPFLKKSLSNKSQKDNMSPFEQAIISLLQRA